MASSCPLGYGGAASKETEASKAPGVGGAEKGGECPLGFDGKGGGSSSSSKAPPPKPSEMDGLSNERQVSSIPDMHGGNFAYPSERQFLKASRAKGHDVEASDMEMVVAIHNAVNERSWQQILEYEKLHEKECPTPKLIRFLGRPGEMSPKARLMSSAFGWTEPFDRHDWHVDRCGTHVRYLVDFYDGKPKPPAPVAIHIDARPEITLGGLRDRVSLWFRKLNVF